MAGGLAEHPWQPSAGCWRPAVIHDPPDHRSTSTKTDPQSAMSAPGGRSAGPPGCRHRPAAPPWSAPRGRSGCGAGMGCVVRVCACALDEIKPMSLALSRSLPPTHAATSLQTALKPQPNPPIPKASTHLPLAPVPPARPPHHCHDPGGRDDGRLLVLPGRLVAIVRAGYAQGLALDDGPEAVDCCWGGWVGEVEGEG